MFAEYINGLIADLRNSSCGSLFFVGCLFYADDIVFLSPTCCDLQRLVNICEQFASTWDIKFNPAKSQLITFGGKNPHCNKIYMIGANAVG